MWSREGTQIKGNYNNLYTSFTYEKAVNEQTYGTASTVAYK